MWQSAIWSALSNEPDELKAASIPVIVVPIFEPRIRGNARSIVINPMLVNGTSDDVNTDELWTRIVKPQPNYIFNESNKLNYI